MLFSMEYCKLVTQTWPDYLVTSLDGSPPLDVGVKVEHHCMLTAINALTRRGYSYKTLTLASSPYVNSGNFRGIAPK
jgi:hypothetical protein